LTQQLSSQVSSSPARNAETVVDTNPVLENQTNTLLALQQQSSAGTSSLQELKDRYAQWGECRCPKEFQQN